MILVTVGGQLPFDRLVQSVDVICHRHGFEGMAQIGSGCFIPQYLDYQRFFPKNELHELACRSRVVVGHAGIGTIITAINAKKPLVMLARRADMGEHRNDHQKATVEQFRNTPGIYCAEDSAEIEEILCDDLKPIDLTNSPERTKLISFLGNRFAVILHAD